MSQFVFLFYGALVTAALAAVWRYQERQMLAVTVWLGWAACVIIDFTLSVRWHPVLFPVVDVIVALAAFSTWYMTRAKPPIVIIVLALGCVLASAAYSLRWLTASSYAYELTLNILFALQCLTLGLWGLSDVVARSLHFPRLGWVHRVAAESDRQSSPVEPG